MSIEKRHDDCPTCDRMAREAERTAVELGRDSWVSEDGTSADPRKHWAVYNQEDHTMSPIIHTPHDCQMPTPEGGTPGGTLYQCPQCRRVYTLAVDVYPAPIRDGHARKAVYWQLLKDPARDAALEAALNPREAALNPQEGTA